AALVRAAVVCGLRSARGRACADVLYVLLAPAAAAFVIARFYPYDPYYAPTLRRMSEDGALPAWWIYGLAALAIVAGVATAIRPRIGLAATAIVLLLSALTALAEGSGH